ERPTGKFLAKPVRGKEEAMVSECPSQLDDDRPYQFGSAHVTETLGDMRFPASRLDLIEHAKTRGAQEDLLGFLERMPDLVYENLDQVLGMASTMEQEAA